MAAIRLLLAATLAVQALVGLGNVIPDSPALQGPGRVPRPTCPAGCPNIRKGGSYGYEDPFSFTPNSSTVEITYNLRTTIGKLQRSRTVELGEVKDVHIKMFEGLTLEGYEMSGPIRYCNGKNIDSECLSIPATTTSATSMITATTITTAITETVTAITLTKADKESSEDSQSFETILLILSVASVLLWMLLVVKSGLNYRRTLALLNRRIVAAKEHGADVSTRLLFSLRDAMVLDFGLRLCMCVLLPGVCVFAYGLYLTTTQDTQNISVAFYILGAACLLVHGFFCIKKVNSVIKTVIVVQHRPSSTSRRRRRRYSSSGEDSSISESIGEMQGCPSRAVVTVLNVCLVLLLICLCVMSYGLYIVLKEAEEAAGQGTVEPTPSGGTGDGNRQ